MTRFPRVGETIRSITGTSMAGFIAALNYTLSPRGVGALRYIFAGWLVWANNNIEDKGVKSKRKHLKLRGFAVSFAAAYPCAARSKHLSLPLGR